MEPNTSTTLQAKGIAPGITVDDLSESITFYEGLGFAIEERWEHEGTLRGVMMVAGKARIGLSQDDWEKGRNRVKGVGMRLFVATDQDVDELAGRATAAGVKLDREPFDTPWNTRAFEATDPTGFKLTVSSD